MPVLPDIDVTGDGTTAAECIAFVRDLVGEETADFYDDGTEILRYINEGKTRLFTRLPILPGEHSFSTVVGQRDYTVPEDIGRYNHVYYGDSELSPVRGNDLPPKEEDGTPESYSPDFINYAGVQQIRLIPTPTAIGTVTIHYWRNPADLSTTPVVVNPSWHRRYHLLPCYYAAGIILEKDNRPENAERMMARFEYGMGEYKRWFYANQPHVDYKTESVAVGEM